MKKLKINDEIHAEKVLLIDEEGHSQGAVSLDQARYLAYEKGYDLALVNETTKPPVCKLIDYGKYLYSQEKQLQKQKATTKTGELKEVRFSLKINEHDLIFKINRVKDFLKRGDKVKVSCQLKGREMMFKDKAKDLIEKVRIESGAIFEKPIERMGNRFFATLIKKQS